MASEEASAGRRTTLDAEEAVASLRRQHGDAMLALARAYEQERTLIREQMMAWIAWGAAATDELQRQQEERLQALGQSTRAEEEADGPT